MNIVGIEDYIFQIDGAEGKTKKRCDEMDVKGKKIMVLGGFGEVGFAICRQLVLEQPAELIVTSLRENEALEAVQKITQEAPGLCRLTPVHGNLFVRWSLKDTPPEQISGNPQYQRWLADDTMGNLTQEILTSSTLYRVILEHRPEIIVDCINTATALAYQNVYQSYQQISQKIQASETVDEQTNAMYQLLSTLCVPPLVRHIQILYEAVKRAKTLLYLKVGTTGTGGMGLNIPFTHGEERPSRLLLAKTAVAGAHSLLLFVMGRTPGGPIVKELKPAALIGWKGVGRGRILKGAKPLPLYDCSPEKGYRLIPGSAFRWEEVKVGLPLEGRELEGVYIDTGENGLFSLDEFKTITTLGLMEFITPEDITRIAILEIKGVNTSSDVLGAIAGAVMGSTYRAGLLRQRVIEQMEALGPAGMAYEILGPPRVAKLIFEAHLIKRCYHTMEGALQPSPEEMSQELEKVVQGDQELRSAAISIGVPILMRDGETLLFASRAHRDKRWEEESWRISPETIEHWSSREWIDLRPQNMFRWQGRFQGIVQETKECLVDTSSCFDRGGSFWARDEGGEVIIDPGEVVGYILIKEETGGRYFTHAN